MPSIDADPYADIRPYTDAEAPAVLARLASNSELANALADLKLQWLKRLSPLVARWFCQRWLSRRLRGVETIADFQLLIEPELAKLIDATAQFSCSGLDRLDSNKSWLFVSNHRDITMDPALTNYAMHHGGHRTLSIAIGDNLLTRSWVADLMRLNKSFVVKRNIKGPRELMAASKQLSGFMRDMIQHNRGPLWIAQREGRAKDGIDATEPAVIKMLSLSRDRKTESIADVLSRLHIVPVAISYELDPCDAMKAAELSAGPSYEKAPDEDVRSIGYGIAGGKGCVHLSFGDPIVGDDLTIEQVVAAIDGHMMRHYRLYETNLWAWQRLEQSDQLPSVAIHSGAVSKQAFYARIDAMPEAIQPFALAMYANPLRQALAVAGEIS